MNLTPISRLFQILLTVALLQPTIVVAAPARLQFDSFDTNRNGTIERDEAPDKRIFDSLDENEDGLVSRAEFGTMNDLLPAPAPVQMTTNLDVAYLEPAAGGNELNRLDIYQPGTGDNHPVLVYVHGGGWSRGDKQAVGFKADHFVAQGYVLVSVNYRMRPKVPITTLQEDLASAVAWVDRNIARYGGDPRNLFLMGHSAGAHLVTMVGTRRDLLGLHRLGLDSIRGVIELDTAALDVPFLMTYSKFHRPIFGSDERVLRAISPTHHVTPGQQTPPFLLVVAANNRQKLVQSRRFANVLKKAGIGVTTIEAPDRTHATLNRNLGSPKDPYTSQIMDFLEENMNQNSNQGETPGNSSVPALMRDVITYSELGIHRTGSSVDLATADWLETRLTQTGMEVSRQWWTVDQYVFTEAAVVTPRRTLTAFPIWYSPGTPPAGISGPLVDLTDDRECAACTSRAIGFVDSRRGAAWWTEFRSNALAEGKLKALLVISPDRSGEGQIQAQNVAAKEVGVALPYPVLLLDARDLPLLKQHSGDPVTVSLDSHTASGTRASNIIGVLKRGPRWVIVSTPYSGWFTCAGERGPGIALLLHLATWAAASDSQYSYLFVANSGHELGFWGARQLLESGLLPAPDDTVAWLHLGASIATPVWRTTPEGLRPDAEITRGRLQMTHERFGPLLADAFGQIPALKPDRGALVGELLDVEEHGYRGFGLVGGGNIHFHTVADTPVTVSPTSLQAVAAALVRSLEQLAGIGS